MAVQITIRGVPGAVRDELVSRASSERKSMQEYLLGELERLARRPSPAQWLRQVRARKELTQTRWQYRVCRHPAEDPRPLECQFECGVATFINVDDGASVRAGKSAVFTVGQRHQCIGDHLGVGPALRASLLIGRGRDFRPAL